MLETPETAFGTSIRAKRKSLLWAIPTLLIVIGVDLSFLSDLSVPAPFFVVLVTVVVAATYGGTGAGLLAAIFASGLLLHGYISDFGPIELTGGLPQALLGSALFFFIGYRLGRTKDAGDKRQSEILAANEKLKENLLSETEEKNLKSAQASDSDDQLRMAIRLSGIGSYRWDFETGNCLYCSEQHAAHFGINPEEFYDLNKGRAPYTGNIHEDDVDAFVEAVARIDGGEAVLFEYRAVHPDGTLRFIRQITEPVFDASGKQIEVVGSSIDLTDLREAEARVRQSQRIEAIGTLTGGVAHDFNNILAIIMGNIELSLESNDPAEQRETLVHALNATHRGASLTRNLLSFARRAHLEPSRLNLNDSVRGTMNWGARILPESISIQTHLDETLWDCELDPTSLENAIVNLVLNARDAMIDGGTIKIETANTSLPGASVGPSEINLSPGRYVMLAITDTGHGIAPGALEKIFEPFHTSKPFGEGSGLGLSMVEGFIKQSGGTVRVTSDPGKGARFELYFKAIETPKADALIPPHEGGARETVEGRILVAEDEGGVARVISQTLRDAGYTVTVAKNGDEGLELFKSRGPFDLLLTDVVMPGNLQGPALATAIRKTDPDIACIFMSGYASDAKIQGSGQNQSDVRLMKPIRRTDLLNAVAAALLSATVLAQ